MQTDLDVSPEEFRKLQAYWFWTIVSRKEEFSVDLIGLNSDLCILPMYYHCSCISKNSHLDIERASFNEEDNNLILYDMIKNGQCQSGSPVNRTRVMHANFELEKQLRKLKVIPRKTRGGWNFSPGRVGTYLIHLAAALDRKPTLKRIFQLNQFVKEVGTNMSQIFCYTIYHKISYVQMAVENDNIELVSFMLGKNPRGFENEALLSSCEAAIVRGNMESCELFVRMFETLYPYQQKKKLLQLLGMTLNHKSYRCAEVVILSLQRLLHGHTLSDNDLDAEFSEKAAKDKTFLTLMIRNRIESLSRWLSKAVNEDDVDTTSWLLSDFGDSLHSNDLLRQLRAATLNNSVKMIRTLTAKLLSSRSAISDNVPSYLENPRYWATVLEYRDCDHALIASGIELDQQDLDHESPLTTAQSLSSSVNQTLLMKIVRRLLDLGYSVDAAPAAQKRWRGDSPLIRAYKDGNIHLMQLFLSLGANPEYDEEIKKLGYSSRFLAECLYYNTDIFSSPSSVVANIIRGGAKKKKLLRLILDCDCDISRKDLMLIRKMSVLTDEDLYRTFLAVPRPLTSICRRVFRRHYGHHIHAVLDILLLPPRLKTFLTLTFELEEFRTLSLSTG